MTDILEEFEGCHMEAGEGDEIIVTFPGKTMERVRAALENRTPAREKGVDCEHNWVMHEQPKDKVKYLCVICGVDRHDETPPEDGEVRACVSDDLRYDSKGEPTGYGSMPGDPNGDDPDGVLTAQKVIAEIRKGGDITAVTWLSAFVQQEIRAAVASGRGE
jgi:hypothetical protein